MNKFIYDFQKKHGLGADGVIGKNTLLKIKNIYMIPTIEATAHFVGNTYHETGGFEVFTENLNYSAAGLLKTFPKYFKTDTSAQLYAKKPEKIANKVYGNRMGNGTEASGDGWKFRGRGALQTTGRTNYTLLGKHLNKDLITHPELVESQYAFDSAVFFFNSNKLWTMAAKVDDVAIEKVRRKINGGINGLDEVKAKVKKYYALMA